MWNEALLLSSLLPSFFFFSLLKISHVFQASEVLGNFILVLLLL